MSARAIRINHLRVIWGSLPMLAALSVGCSTEHTAKQAKSASEAADAGHAHDEHDEHDEHDASTAHGGNDASDMKDAQAAEVDAGTIQPNDGLPCPVSDALIANCQKCHSATPMFGAPMSLVTYADLQKPAPSDSKQTVAQMALKRLNDKASPMPPGGNIGDDARNTLTTWLAGGAKQAPEDMRVCDPHEAVRGDDYWRAGLTAGPDETCYNFTNHNGQKPDDTTAYQVIPGEHYEQFYFKVPWGKDVVATKFGTKFDNVKVIHHWLFFTTNKAESAAGTHETTIGTTIGDSSTLLAGWAVGGDNLIFSDDVGLQLPESGMLNAQWHFFNQGSDTESDASSLQVCVVPKDKRKNIAGITFLGTENLNGILGMPAKTVSKYSGSCLNDSGGPITIWGFTPHMHKLGRHMNTVIKRKDGTSETVFDRDFDFNSQITYPASPLIVLQAGETIVSTCTFDNDTNAAVPFGPSTNQEMCYNFTMSYPAQALDNGTFSLIGAKNVCW